MLLAYGTAMLKVAARTEGLRKAPGQMGELKRVDVQGRRRRRYLTADWAYVVDEPTSEFPCCVVVGSRGGEMLTVGCSVEVAF